MKILVLGCKGMLGHVLLERLKKEYKDVIGYSRENFDIVKNTESLLENITARKFDVVINCIGFLRPKESDIDNAIFINGNFPHLLAEVVNRYGGKVIQISTDCVFDGKDGNYRTTSVGNAKDVYGFTKSLGELDDNKNLTIRTSMIGREIEGRKRNLVEWFLQQKQCEGYKNHIWNGLTTDELSNAIVNMIKLNKIGLFTVASPEAISKYELLILLKKRYKTTAQINPVDSSETINRSLVSDVHFIKSIKEQVKEMK